MRAASRVSRASVRCYTPIVSADAAKHLIFATRHRCRITNSAPPAGHQAYAAASIPYTSCTMTVSRDTHVQQ
jgi:hypothetical protein